MENPGWLTVFFIVIAAFAVLVNILLIILALRIPKRTYDINLALLLAFIDMLLPFAVIGFTVENLIARSSLSVPPTACQFKGPVGYLGMHFSMMLVSIIAFTRVNRVYNMTVPKLVWVLLGVYNIAYVGIAIAAGVESRYKLLPNGIDCAPNAAEDYFSFSLTVIFAVSLVSFLLITLVCYVTLIFKMFPDEEDTILPLQNVSNYNNITKIDSIPRPRRVKAAIRTTIVCITYFVLIIPPCLLLTIESKLPSEKAHMISTAIDICLNSVAIANPCLVLLTHSLIYQHLCLLFKPLFRFNQKE